ncbi:hypothetical protein [Corynebacterium sp. AOP12-C2-36]|uniref:hypothetical protein n=1 Tax=Corynebacterium sp. AOP12-C2-36 TaxID=3457723 RepID=UPI00403323C0
MTPWATPRQDTITDGDGNPRGVRVIDTDAGPAVIDDDGVATGEILTTSSTDTTNNDGSAGVRQVEGLAGVDLTDRTGRDDERNASTSSTTDTPRSTESTESSGSSGASEPSEAAGVGGAGGVTGDGDDGGTPVPAGLAGPLGAGGAAAGGVGALLAQRAARGRRRDGAHRADIDWGGGREQSLILLEGPDSPREHRFDMDVPAGGQMVKNPDGSVDVLDADGNIVEHVKAPWAYDASGRPVDTYYEVDNETGELIQVVDPQHATALPILADPDKQDTGDDTGSDSGTGRDPLDPMFEGSTKDVYAAAEQKAEEQRQDNNDFSRAANSNQNPADTDDDTSDGDAATGDNGRPPFTDYVSDDGTPMANDGDGNATEDPLGLMEGNNTGSQPVDDPVSGVNESDRDGPAPTTGVGGTAAQPPFTDALSPAGDHVAKGGDGEYDIDPLDLDDTGESRSFDDGSAQIDRDNGNSTRYLPNPTDEQSGGSNNVEMIDYDQQSNRTTQTMEQNGQRSEVSQTGRPDSAAPVGSPEAEGALNTIPTNPPTVIADPNTTPADPPVANQSVPGVGVVNPADPPAVVNHPGQNSADVYPGNGQQPVRVNPDTGEQIGLGTTDNPLQGPFVPRTFEWVPDTITNAPPAADPASQDPGASVAGAGAGDVALGAAAGAASAADRANNDSGRNGKPVGAHRQDTAAERAGRGIGAKNPARALGVAGNVVTGVQAGFAAAEDPDHAGGAIGGGIVGNIGSGAAGAYIGGAAGALTGPFAPIAIPLGGAIGGEIGNRVLTPVGQAIQDLFK